MLFWARLVLFCSVVVYGELSGCFDIERGKKFECATPTIRRSPITEAECRQLCLTQPADCQAANYNYYKRICELFDVPPDVSSSRRRLVRSLGCAGGPSLIRTLGVTFLVPKSDCLLPKDQSNLRRSEPMKPVISVQMPPDSLEKPPKNPFNDIVVSGEKESSGLHKALHMLPIVPDCPIGERARVQIIEGVTVAVAPTISFNVDMPEKCIEACRMNAFPSGTRLPLLCRSATFDRRTSNCAVFSDALNPNGYLEYKPDNVVLYMEKLCFPDAVLPLSCDELFRRVPQHILLGHAAEIVTASSQTECVKECVLAKLRHVDCHSVMHYLDVPYQNCILNIHSRHSRPEYFLPELRMKVDYIEVPACAVSSSVSEQNDAPPIHEPSHPVKIVPEENKYALAQEKLNSVSEGRASVEFDWSEWSSCDPMTGIRKRERICTDCKQNVENEPCIPNEKNEFNEALQKFVADQEKLEENKIPELEPLKAFGETPKKSENSPETDERAGFMRKEPPTKIIPFPNRDESTAVQEAKKEPSPANLEFFGPPLKTEDTKWRFSY